MTPEETALLTEELEQAISAEDIAEILPLTQGDGSVYRKDEETGKVTFALFANISMASLKPTPSILLTK